MKKTRFLFSVGCVAVSVAMILVLLNITVNTFSKRSEIAELEKNKATLKNEMKELKNEVDLLDDDGYVTRYARENYIFTKDGEKVAILPESK